MRRSVHRPKGRATDTIDVQLRDWDEAISLIKFLDVRGLHGFPVPGDPSDGRPLIRVVCPVPATARVETFVALHAFLDSGATEELTLHAGGRAFTMQRKLQSSPERAKL